MFADLSCARGRIHLQMPNVLIYTSIGVTIVRKTLVLETCNLISRRGLTDRMIWKVQHGKTTALKA